MNRMTHFALMMQMFQLSPRDIATRLNTDTTLVSRWRTGNRRIMPNRHWAYQIADMFYREDQKREEPVLIRLISALEPDLDMSSVSATVDAIRVFLTTPRQAELEYHQRVVGLVNELMAGEIEAIQYPKQASDAGALTVVGSKAVWTMALDFAEEALRLSSNNEVLFFCPDGLASLTVDPRYSQRLLNLMNKELRGDAHITAVLGTNADAAVVKAFSPTWLGAHMSGHVESYYYDVFYRQDHDMTVGVVRGKKALVITANEAARALAASVYTDQETVESLYRRVSEYIGGTTVRLNPGYLSSPSHYLYDTKSFRDQPCYLFMHMPQFGLLAKDEYAPFYRMDDDCVDMLWTYCMPLVQPVAGIKSKRPVRHVFCQTTIDEVLLSQRRMLPAMSELCGKRVFMTAQNLVDALKRIRELMLANKHYEVCFLPQGMIADMATQYVSWGDSCVICWIDEKGSAIANSHYIAKTLHKYCASLWDGIPQQLRSRAAALKQIDQWLKKAKLYGLDV